MPRKASGQIISRKNADGTVTFGARFPAYGKRHYVTLGSTRDGMTREMAEVELDNILADVRRGIWKPAAPPAPPKVPQREQTFHEFASEWFAGRELEGLAVKTLGDLRWSLTNHLLPFFKDFPLSAITPQLVDQYKLEKAAERQRIERAREEAEKRGEKFEGDRGLSNGSINHTLRHLTQILEAAVDYELIESNPAAGKRRRLKAAQPARPWVEPEQLMALLAAAPAAVGRVLLEILAGAGLRIGEALGLRWRDVDLGSGTLYIRKSKTEAGVREVHLTPALRERLAIWRSESKHTRPEDYVLTSTGNRLWPTNLRRDVLTPAVAKANVELAKLGIAPIGRITFHSLRRTYASLRAVCGDDARYTADQIGHTDPKFTFRVYAQASKRRERLAPAQRAAFDAAVEWAQMGTSDELKVPELPVPEPEFEV